MNWNPFKRIAELQRELNGLKLSHNRLIERVDKLNDLNNRHKALHNWVGSLADRHIGMNERLNSYAAAAPVRSEGAPVFTEAEVDAEAERKRLQKREYNKAWYAKQRAKEKQRKYNADYRARKKAAAAAALVVGGTE